jgi:hypothetical protein
LLTKTDKHLPTHNNTGTADALRQKVPASASAGVLWGQRLPRLIPLSMWPPVLPQTLLQRDVGAIGILAPARIRAGCRDHYHLLTAPSLTAARAACGSSDPSWQQGHRLETNTFLWAGGTKVFAAHREVGS